jgi:molybdate transport system substrate-binding protein
MTKPRLTSAFQLALLLSLYLLPTASSADKITIASASNFAPTLKAIAPYFERQTGHRIVISTASTGKHFAQIKQGAPFDIFFAADSEHPQLLEQTGAAVAGSRFTYALGVLVLWSTDPDILHRDASVLRKGDFRYLAIANPQLAPYGRAAKQVLEDFKLWDHLQTKIVRGENIGQAFQFIYSGNAQLGFVARAQLTQLQSGNQGSAWPVPQSLYGPIEQQAVLITHKDSAKAFLDFVKTPQMLEIIQRFGYGIPNVN